MKHFFISLCILIIFLNRADCQNTSSENGNNFVSAGYWLFGDETGSFHNAFVKYERLVVRSRLNISVTPHFGLNRKSYGGAVGLKFVAGANKPRQFLIGPQFHTWVQDETYYENGMTTGDPQNPPKKEVHQTTKGAFALDLGLRRNFNPLFFTIGAQLGTVVFNSFEKKAEKMDPVLRKEKSVISRIIPGVNVGFGYRF